MNYFHSLMFCDALKTFKNNTSLNKQILGEILTVFRRRYVKPKSMATTKDKYQRLVFNPANQKLIDVLDELQKLAEDAFGVAAQVIIEQVIYAKIPHHQIQKFRRNWRIAHMNRLCHISERIWN